MSLEALAAALAYLWLVATVYTRTLEATKSPSKALLSTLLAADIATAALILLGVDRPLFTLCTRLGCTTITALELLLATKLAATIYTALQRDKLEHILG